MQFWRSTSYDLKGGTYPNSERLRQDITSERSRELIRTYE